MDSAAVYPIHGIGEEHHVYDEIALLMVNPKLYANEPGLFKTKHWDYRFLHPVEATYLFASIYNRQFALACTRRIDIERAPYIRGAKGKDVMLHNKTQATGLVKARQWADSHGMPYDFHCYQALKYAEERDWKFLPKPSQLYSEKKALDETTMRSEVMLKWEKEKRERLLTVGFSAYYKQENYKGTELQKRHQAHIIQELKANPGKQVLLAVSLIYDRQVLSPVVYRVAFGLTALRTVQRIANEQGLVVDA